MAEKLRVIAIICYILSAGFLVISMLVFFLMDMRQVIGRLTGSAQRKALARMRRGEYDDAGMSVVNMSTLEKNPLPRAPSGELDRRSRRLGRTGKTPPSRRLQRDPVPSPSQQIVRQPPSPSQQVFTAPPSPSQQVFTAPPSPSQQVFTAPPAPVQQGTSEIFGEPYPNKTPPTPVPQSYSPPPAVSAAGVVPAGERATVFMTDDVPTALVGDNEPETLMMDAGPAAQRSDTAPGRQNVEPSVPVLVRSSANDAVTPSRPVQMKILDDFLLIHTNTFVDIK